jgi:DNA-binding NarL/FixJ family response regulator
MPGRLNLMIAPRAPAKWADRLARSFADLPIDLHWSWCDTEAVGLAANGDIQVAVLDAKLPLFGGLDALRRIRRLGIDFKCLLVCEDPDQRLLQDALALDVFSVLRADAHHDTITPMVHKAIRQTYQVGETFRSPEEPNH